MSGNPFRRPGAAIGGGKASGTDQASDETSMLAGLLDADSV